MCAYQDYYEDFKSGYWAREDAEECKCRGSGWALSEVDTWHPCPVHFRKGQRHPDDEDEEKDVCDWGDPDDVCLTMDEWKRAEEKMMDEWLGDGDSF